MVLATAVMATACQDENLVKQPDIPAQVGDEIVFKANSGYEMDARSSRTVYSGDSYTEGDKTYERIEWEPDVDIIGIYCEVANNKQYADYRVIADPNATTNTKTHTALLARHEQNSGLHWGSADDHEFFAIYPSPTIPDHNSATTSLVDKVKLEGNTLSGYIPTTQPMIGDPVSNKNFTVNGTTARTATLWAKPDMRYSYMIARTTASPEDAAVNLEFHPISTALEIEITQPTSAIVNEVGVANITLHSKSGKPLTGYFTCDIDDNGNPTNIKTSNTSDVLTIQLDPTKTKLRKGEILRVTALMLPMTNIDDLEITISGDDDFGGDMHGALTGVKLTAHKKHYITNLPLKTPNPNDNIWIRRLNDSILLGSLSIPGAANSFSSSYNGSNANSYKTQSKSFDELWQMGVRCFELVCDRTTGTANGDKDGSLKIVDNLGNATLRCNNIELNKNTIGGTITTLIKTLEDEIYKDEFAMVILTYQPTGDGQDAPRDAGEFMSALRNYYDTNFPNDDADDKLILYSPDLTVEDARGKLMIIARPSQEGEDSPDNVTNSFAGAGYDILTVKGWGTLTDKWYKRGYNTKLFVGQEYNGGFVEVKDNMSSHSDLDEMEDWIFGPFTNRSYRPTGVSSGYSYFNYSQKNDASSRPTKGTQDFSYASDQGYDVWAQEWRRISNTTRTGTNNNYWAWFESFEEKKTDILDTYERATASSLEDKTVFFNSLDGFFIDHTDIESCGPYWYGNRGDIKTYATAVNLWFYNTVLSKAAENFAGKMGVVIMDYLGEDLSSEISGTLLPKIIYNNNFKSALPKGIPGAYKNESGGGTGGNDGEDEGGFGGGGED